MTTSGNACCWRTLYCIHPGPEGSRRIFSRTVPAYCQNLPTACATATCCSGSGRPQVFTVWATENSLRGSMSSCGIPRKFMATVSGTE